MSNKFTTGACRLSYAHLFQPAADLNGNEKYSASFIISKSDERTKKRYDELMKQMLTDPDIKRTLGNGGTPRMPLRDGDTDRPNDAAYENSWFLNAKSNPDHKPLILDRDRQEIVDPNDIYSGCYVQAVVNFYAYNKGGNKGIGCSLSAVRKLKDGQPLSGTTVSDKDFDDSLIDNSMSEFF